MRFKYINFITKWKWNRNRHTTSLLFKFASLNPSMTFFLNLCHAITFRISSSTNEILNSPFSSDRCVLKGVSQVRVKFERFINFPTQKKWIKVVKWNSRRFGLIFFYIYIALRLINIIPGCFMRHSLRMEWNNIRYPPMCYLSQ